MKSSTACMASGLLFVHLEDGVGQEGPAGQVDAAPEGVAAPVPGVQVTAAQPLTRLFTLGDGGPPVDYDDDDNDN